MNQNAWGSATKYPGMNSFGNFGNTGMKFPGMNMGATSMFPGMSGMNQQMNQQGNKFPGMNMGSFSGMNTNQAQRPWGNFGGQPGNSNNNNRPGMNFGTSFPWTNQGNQQPGRPANNNNNPWASMFPGIFSGMNTGTTGTQVTNPGNTNNNMNPGTNNPNFNQGQKPVHPGNIEPVATTPFPENNNAYGLPPNNK